MHKLKQNDRERIANDVSSFLKSGGRIDKIPNKFKSRFDNIKNKTSIDDLIDVNEAAIIIGCTIQHVSWLFRSGFIKERKSIKGYGRKYFYSRNEIKDFVKVRKESEKTI